VTTPAIEEVLGRGAERYVIFVSQVVSVANMDAI
jgi:hypothetical protein